MEEMKKLYKELQVRMEVLENERKKLPTDDLIDDIVYAKIKGQIDELELVIIRVQQILLANIKK